MVGLLVETYVLVSRKKPLLNSSTPYKFTKHYTRYNPTINVFNLRFRYYTNLDYYFLMEGQHFARPFTASLEI